MIEKEELVSIVVPVYNAQNTLTRCIRSILVQSYMCFELILVDDGSTDGSGLICDWYAKRDGRVKVFHIQNCGASVARNVALNHVAGELLYFVDADDYLEKKTIQILVETKIKSKSDMSVCRYFKLYKGKKIANYPLECPGVYSNKEYYIHTMKDPGHHYYGVVWNKLYDSKIVKQNHILFKENVTLGEDFIFNLNYLRFVNKVSVIAKPLYNYSRSGSDTLSRKESSSYRDCMNELVNRKKIYKEYVKILKEYGIYEENRKQIEKYWIMFYVRQMYHLRFNAKLWSKREKQEWITILKKEAIIKQSIKKITKYELFWRKACFCFKTLIKFLFKRLFDYIWRGRK